MATTQPKNLILSIYAHVMLAIGVLVTAAAVYFLLRNLTGRFLVNEYPLGFEEGRCDFISPAPYFSPTEVGLTAEQFAAERQAAMEQNEVAKDECVKGLAETRDRKSQTDFTEAINILIVGLLILLPHAVVVSRLNKSR